MAYLIFTVKGRELGRRSLNGPLVIGRAQECDVCVHDILLSRRHCRLEPEGNGWALVDLASKNGTFIGGREVGRQVLSDGTAIRIGKTSVTFCLGQMHPASNGAAARPNKPRIKRPADPWEAMSGTVSGLEVLREKQEKQQIGARKRIEELPAIGTAARLPIPQPSPREPDAYEADDVYSMLSGLASSSWDSIYMDASRPTPTRPPPRPIIGSRHPRYRRSAAPVDLSLQVSPGLLAPPAIQKPVTPWRRRLLRMARGFAAVGQTIMIVGAAHLLR